MTAEATKFLEKIDANFLNCGICFGRYQNAKSLSCGHNFCQKCLSTLAGKSFVLFCPVCRQKQIISTGGVVNLPNNFFLNELVRQFSERDEKLTDSKKCGGCDEGDNTVRCVDCAMFLCDICTRTHRKVPMTRGHKLVSLADYNKTKSTDPALVQPPMYCSKHPIQPLKYYCDTCEVPICLECTALDHKITEHNYRYLKDAATEYTKELVDMVAMLKTKERKAKMNKQQLQRMLQSLDSRVGVEEKKLDDYMEKTIMEITRMIRENGKQLTKQLKEEYGSRQQKLEAQYKELDIAENYLSNVVEFAEELIHSGNAAKMMSAKTGMTSQMKELMTIEVKGEPVDDDDIEFKKSEDFFKDKSLGEIVTGSDIKYKLADIPDIKYKLADIPKVTRIGEDIKTAFTRQDKSDRKQTERTKKEDIKAEMKTPDNKIKDVKVRDKNSARYTGTMAQCHEQPVHVRNKPTAESLAATGTIPQKGLICKVGKPGKGKGQLGSIPSGIALTKERYAAVCDRGNNRLQLFDIITGKDTQIIECKNLGQPCKPNFVAISANGQIFFTDTGNNQVNVCDENGKWIRCFGKGDFEWPVGIAISPVNGRVYVADMEAFCIRIYQQDGVCLSSFHCDGDGRFNSLYDINISKNGNVIVADQGNNCIQIFDSDGKFLYKFGRKGNYDGQINRPFGVTTDRDGNIYVSSYGNGKVQKFDCHGNFICRIDSDGDGLKRATGICVTDDEPRQVIVVDCGNSCMRVYSQ
ncbi:E3 ubiquitin-protein ligase TRIM71-like [Glandiceps talaboti]